MNLERALRIRTGSDYHPRPFQPPFSAETSPYDRMFLVDFLEVSRLHRSRPALVVRGDRFDYGTLAARVASIAKMLSSLPPDEQLVGIVAHDHVDTYAALIATLFVGRCYVPLNPLHPAQRNQSILDQTQLQTVFAAERSDAVDVWIRTVPRVVTSQDCPPVTDDLTLPPYDPNRWAYLLFTSGTSGIPKGVPITVGNVDAFLDAFFASAAPIGPDDRALQMFDLTFDFSVVAYLAPLARGACFYTVPSDVIKFTFIAGLVEEEQLTQLPLVPSVISHLRPYFDDMRFPWVRHAYFCGEALHADVLAGFADCIPNARLTNYYGPTEATVFAMYYTWDKASGPPRANNGIVSIGSAMDGMYARIVDERGIPTALGEKGELCLAGPQLTPGYFQDPQRNATAFITIDGTRFYRTGDAAREEPDGSFTFLGRLDTQVKVQGYRVELAEIEHHARSLVEPCGAVVLAIANDTVTRLHLVLEGFTGEAATVLHGLKDRLPPYMIPTSVSIVRSLPLNANGKVDRLRLRDEVTTSSRT